VIGLWGKRCDVFLALNAKKPRLLLVIADCCDDWLDGSHAGSSGEGHAIVGVCARRSSSSNGDETMGLSRWIRVWRLLPLLAATVLAGDGAKAGVDVMATDKPDSVGPVVEENTRFAFDLYGRLRAKTGNRFISPYSISIALAMTYAGARGETAGQMALTLHFALPPDRLHPAFHTLIGHINGDASAVGGTRAPARRYQRYELVTANALWGDQGDTFLPEFLDLTRVSYGAGLHQVDFRHASTQAVKVINAWVEKQTQDKIRDLLAPSDVSPATSLVLTNAIYFKGDWASPFVDTMTRKDGMFTAPGGRKVPTPLMRQTGKFPYFDGETFQLLEMPYAGSTVAMVVLLPKAPDGLGALEARLTASNLSTWLGKTSRSNVAVEFPRFTVTETVRLAAVLREMGMPLAFAGGDFSGMNGQRNLAFSEVIHKAFVDVNEKGTEAAAATAVVMSAGSSAREPKIIKFLADRPFVFLIRDLATGSILFLGRLVEPKG
jgi:serpin B